MLSSACFFFVFFAQELWFMLAEAYGILFPVFGPFLQPTGWWKGSVVSSLSPTPPR